MASSLLESLVDPKVDVEPVMQRYRRALHDAVEAGLSPDDSGCAETLAGLARRLGLTATEIRADHRQFIKRLTLERRFDADALPRLEAELEERRKLEMMYTQSGFECQRRGYVKDDDGGPYKCEQDRRFDVLKAQYDTSTGDARLEVAAEMQAVKDEADRLAVARRQTEEQVIGLLNSQDRLGAFRRGNRRLFPEADD